MAFTARLTARFHFEAAHHMPNFPIGHPNRRPHGHSYEVDVTVEGPVQADSGVVMDHAELTAAAGPVVAELDHAYLNEIHGLELPTGECIARWVWNRLSPSLPLLSCVRVNRPSCGISIEYDGPGADPSSGDTGVER